ncbi:MAG: diaminopimelate epimerase [Clostridiaceae bacterium]|nr:diaminopimelate epimerase [Eubacteriales bacterium]
MRFTKAHGLGNDFILLDDRAQALRELSALAQTLCDRRTGIGGDGVILVEPSGAAAARMRIINSDGSEAEMCGNGIRCFAKYVYDKGIVKKSTFCVETLAGIMEPTLETENGRAKTVTVGMGKPVLEREKIPVEGAGTCLNQKLIALGREFIFSTVLLGVPHTVVFTEELSEADVLKYGPAIETHPLFPRKTNVNFTTVLSGSAIRVRTWERGCGATLACGTGSSSAAVCCALAGFTGRDVTVHLPLGELFIRWAEDDTVFMTGPAAFVYEGEIDLSRFL